MAFKKGNKVGRQFQPGQSGNPKGGSKARTLRMRLREVLDQELEGGGTKAQAVVDALVAAAIAGEVRAIALVIENADGKVTDKHEIDFAVFGSSEFDKRMIQLARRKAVRARVELLGAAKPE
jgi:hypothetical protein